MQRTSNARDLGTTSVLMWRVHFIPQEAELYEGKLCVCLPFACQQCRWVLWAKEKVMAKLTFSVCILYLVNMWNELHVKGHDDFQTTLWLIQTSGVLVFRDSFITYHSLLPNSKGDCSVTRESV